MMSRVTDTDHLAPASLLSFLKLVELEAWDVRGCWDGALGSAGGAPASQSPRRAAPLGVVGGAPGPRLRFGPGGSQGLDCVSQAHALPAEQKEQAAAPSLRLTQRKRTATASLVPSLREEGRLGAGEQGSGGEGGWALLFGRPGSRAHGLSSQPRGWAWLSSRCVPSVAGRMYGGSRLDIFLFLGLFFTVILCKLFLIFLLFPHLFVQNCSLIKKKNCSLLMNLM